MPQSNSFKTVLIYWHQIKQYPQYLAGLLITTPITVLTGQYLPPLILANVLNRLAKGQYQAHALWSSFGTDILGYAFLTFLSGTLMWRIVDSFGWRLEANVQRDLARRIYRHLISQGANFHANSFSGSLVSQTNKMLSSYIRTADTMIYQTSPMLLGLIFTTIILFHRATLFVFVLLFISITYLVVAILVSRRVRVKGAKMAASESAQTGYLADSMTNVMAIKSFAGTEYENAAFDKKTSNTEKRLYDFAHAIRNQNLFLSTLTNTMSALSLAIAVIGVLVYHANLATVFLILNYTMNIAQQLWTFGTTSLRNFNRSFSDASEMTDILAIEPEIKDPEEPEKVRIKDGQVEFKNVTFQHEGAGEALFKNLDLTIKSGQKVGVVGHSGSGKTTFMRLLLRFNDLDSGEILIDGQNIAHLKQDDLRRNIAYVPQEPIMFHRTLMENIQYGQLDAPKTEVLKAAKTAHANEFIDELPTGYETMVGERGIKLSGGQRQRIAIARAILKNAPILVLDEATSALDSESEILIQDALWKLMDNRTAIVIAHRLSTIQKMDRIIVMEGGEIVEEGTHPELIKAKGVYAQLWAHQSGGFIDD